MAWNGRIKTWPIFFLKFALVHSEDRVGSVVEFDVFAPSLGGGGLPAIEAAS